MQQLEWMKCKAHELRAHANDDAVVILPVASIEQHGPHLPTMTDTLLAYETSVRAARLVHQRGGKVVVAPTVWSGLSEHHVAFGGTLTVDYQTFYLSLRALVDSMTRQGFRRILINNGHGGNMDACKMATQELTLEFGIPLVSTTYPVPAMAGFKEVLEDQDFVMHAGEAETSMVMALRPELVDDSNLAGCANPYEGSLGEMHSSYRWQGFAARTRNGVLGDPTRASAEKGERLLDLCAEGLAKLILDTDLWGPSADIRLDQTGGVPLKDD